MRHAFSLPVLAIILTLAVVVSTARSGSAAEKAAPKAAAPAKPCPAALDKVKALGTHLGRALDVALDLMSGNEADFLSKNKTALLSGNSPKLLSENQTPIFSGNTFSLFSNIRVEIHIENSGNSIAPQQPANPGTQTRR